MGFDRVVGNCDQIYLRVAPSNQRMGKMIAISFDYIGDLFEIWQGGLRFYNESQLDAIKKALFEYDQKNDTKAVTQVYLTYSSDQVCSVTGNYCYFELTKL